MHGHSGGVLPGPISNPEVKPSCVSSSTVVREPTGMSVTVPLSFPSDFPATASAVIWPYSALTEYGLFTLNHTNLLMSRTVT